MKGIVFTIMPFSDAHMRVYRTLIKPTVEGCGLTSSIVADFPTSDIIIKDIINGILGAQFVIADVTGRNANVAYELGIADSFRKRVIIITQNEHHVPFDYKHRRYFKYRIGSKRSRKGLCDCLSQALMNTAKSQSDIWATPISNQLFFKYDSDPLDILSTVLYRTHLDNKYTSSINAVTRVDESGNGVREEMIELTSHSTISHILYDVFIDKPGLINLEKAVEIVGVKQKPLKWAVYLTSTTRLSAFIIFRNVLRAGDKIKLLTKVSAQNYFSDLTETGKERYPFSLGAGARISKLRETYIFPKTPHFASLKATILSHPDRERVGRESFPRNEKGKLVLHIDCSARVPRRTEGKEILVDFQC